MKMIVVAIGLVGVAGGVNGQRGVSDFELGVRGGITVYQGDLTPSPLGSLGTMRYELGVNANFILSSRFAVRGDFNYGKLRGNDAKYNDKVWRRQRNFQFKSTYREVSAMLEWNLLNKNYERMNTGLYPYLFGGVGYTFYDLHRDVSRFNRNFFSSQTYVLNGLAADTMYAEKGFPVLPVGGGLRYPISGVLSIKAEAMLRFSATDYIDGFSKAAEAKQKDKYYSATIGIIFTPFSGGDHSMRCPVLRY